jgi:hypothetical protein
MIYYYKNKKDLFDEIIKNKEDFYYIAVPVNYPDCINYIKLSLIY